MNIRAVFLNGNSLKQDFATAFGPKTLVKDRPTVVILLPEMLFRSDTIKCVVDDIDHERLSLFVIDEAHLIHKWGEFRTAFKRMETIKTLFSCPILLLSATMKTINVKEMLNNVVRANALVFKGNIDRENVSIKLLPYNPGTESGWLLVAKQVWDLINREKAIDYYSYAKQCDKLHECLSGLNLKSVAAGNSNCAEKVAIYRKMKKGEIDLLVATTAFAMGSNIPGVIHVIQIGLPQNLSLFVKELGISGREGSAYIFICKQFDLKRLSYWTKEVSDNERLLRYEDFRQVCEFVSSAFVKNCLKAYFLQHFDSTTNSEPHLNP
jgi:ATP-dependent DNA helicase RecQ